MLKSAAIHVTQGQLNSGLMSLHGCAGAKAGDLCDPDDANGDSGTCQDTNSCGVCVTPDTYAAYTDDYTECNLDDFPADVAAAPLLCAGCGKKENVGDQHPRLCCPFPEAKPGYVPHCAGIEDGYAPNICNDAGLE